MLTMQALTEIRRLARTGEPTRAWAAFVAVGGDRIENDHRVLTLKGRLLKDLAMRASGDERILLLRRAAEAYAAASTLTDDSYPRINAATLVRLRGDRATAAALASDLLELLDQGKHGAETPYWLLATRAEALVLLDRIADARAALTEAVRVAPDAREDRAATLRQLRRILAHDSSDASWLDAFALRPTMHFRGPMALVGAASEQAIVERVNMIGASLAFGALAAGTDIVAAEAALAAGAELHVVLPSEIARFRAGSVDPLGSQWGARFDMLLDAASSVEILDEPGGLSEASVRMADDMAMGMAVAEALVSDTLPVMLRARLRGTANTPLLRAVHRIETVDLDVVATHAAPPLPPPLAPVCVIVRNDDSDHRIVPLDGLHDLPTLMMPGDVCDLYVPDADGHESPRSATLRSLEVGARKLLSRPAALVAIAQCPDCRPILVGTATGPDGPVDIYELAED